MRYAIDRQNQAISNFKTAMNQDANPQIDILIEKGIKMRRTAAIEKDAKLQLAVNAGVDINASYIPAVETMQINKLTEVLSETQKITKKDRIESRIGVFKNFTITNGWNPNLKTKFTFDNYIPSLQVGSAILRAFRKMAENIKSMKDGDLKNSYIEQFVEFTDPKNATKLAKALTKELSKGKTLKAEFDREQSREYTK